MRGVSRSDIKPGWWKGTNEIELLTCSLGLVELLIRAVRWKSCCCSTIQSPMGCLESGWCLIEMYGYWHRCDHLLLNHNLQYYMILCELSRVYINSMNWTCTHYHIDIWHFPAQQVTHIYESKDGWPALSLEMTARCYELHTHKTIVMSQQSSCQRALRSFRHWDTHLSVPQSIHFSHSAIHFPLRSFALQCLSLCSLLKSV